MSTRLLRDIFKQVDNFDFVFMRVVTTARSQQQVVVLASTSDHANLLVIVDAAADAKDRLACHVVLPPASNTLKEVKGAR